MPNKKRIYVAYTGGTIGMTPNSQGTYEPTPGYLEQRMCDMSELRDPSMPEWVLNEYETLLDSSDMCPDDWERIARDIHDNYEAFDGFIVLHGTDTMAYTASALAFLLQDLAKPVILTGSQIPLYQVRNDARQNIVTAMVLAALEPPIPEVGLYFGDRLMRGCRSTKVSADGFRAFRSPNIAPLATVGVELEINRALIRKPRSGKPLVLRKLGTPTVASIRLFPGIRAEFIRSITQPPLQGLVLEAFGVGNGPDRNSEFMAALKAADERGVVLVCVTQCVAGSVHLGEYTTGVGMAKAGVISGYDMTPEAALAKLYYLLSHHTDPSEIKRRMCEDLRGELSKPSQLDSPG